jgi:hypothetical protein
MQKTAIRLLPRRRPHPRAQQPSDVLDVRRSDEQAARQLAAHLAVLIEADVIEPCSGSGGLRFAAVGPGGEAA